MKNGDGMWRAVAPSHQSSSNFKELGALEKSSTPLIKPGHKAQGPIPEISRDRA